MKKAYCKTPLAKLFRDLPSLLLIIFFMLLSPVGSWAQVNTATTTGAWETGTNWSLNHAPLNVEDVVVPVGRTMTINANHTCLSLTINGRVNINGNRSLTVTNSFTNAGLFTPPGNITLIAGSFSNSGTFVPNGNDIITIGGNFTNSGMFTPNGSDNITIGGNFTNSFNFSLSNGGSSLTFNGNAAQTISDNALLTIPNLILNNTSGLANGVTLNTPASVTGALTLTDGLVNTTLTNILTLIAGATSTVGSATSYVNGPMAKTGNSVFIFPTGGGGRYAPVGISAPPHPNCTITAQFIFACPPNPNSCVGGLANASTMEYWNMSENHPGNPVQVTLYWQNSPGNGIYTFNNTLRVASYNGATWGDLGNAGLTGAFPGAGSVTSNNNINNFNNLHITFGTRNALDNPLPITLSSFTATYLQENNSVLVNFTVATQLNNKEFVIEKTTDGIVYTEVAIVPGAGTTPFTESYSAVDPNPTPGISYYRLKQIDMDENPTVFPPAVITIGNDQNNSLSIYPNPVTTNLNVIYMSSDEAPLSIDIFDMAGRKASSSFSLNNVKEGINNFSINASDLTSGIYIVRVTGAQKSYSLRFVKQP